MTNSQIRDGGLSVVSFSTPVSVVGNTVERSPGVGIFVSDNYFPWSSSDPQPTFRADVRNNTVNGSGAEAIVIVASYIDATKLSGNDGSGNRGNVVALSGTMTVGTTWNAGGFPPAIKNNDQYHRGLTVAAGATLTLGPGVVVKAIPGTWCWNCTDAWRAGLTVEGSLVASGTAGSPVVFTTFSDDSVGGDTNGDGSATTPTPGEWYGIGVSGSVTLNRATVGYGSVSVNPSGPSRNLSIAGCRGSMRIGWLVC